MILSSEEAKSIVEKVLSRTSADAVRVYLSGGRSNNLRFARNTVTTSGATNNVSLTIRSTFGKRSGSYSVNQLDEDTLRGAVMKAEELAKLSPEDPEEMPPLEPQSFHEIHAYYEDTVDIPAEYRSRNAAEVFSVCDGKGVTAAGFMEDGDNFSAIGNSAGLFGYQKSTRISYSVTVRTDDGTGSGWAEQEANTVASVDMKHVSEAAIAKARMSANPKTLEPGVYPVILEPAATAELIEALIFSMSARSADEGRSFFSEKEGKNKVGEKLFPDYVTIRTDPENPEAPGSAWGEDGLPQRANVIFEKGIVKTLFYSRYWAFKQGVKPVPFPSNLIIEGGDASLEDLIRSTERAVLVTRFWYIRSVDPQTILLTGLTRDGTFWVENGAIAHPIKNFRWNESPVAMLKNVEMIGKPVRVGGSLIPPLKVKEFTFTSLSDAV